MSIATSSHQAMPKRMRLGRTVGVSLAAILAATLAGIAAAPAQAAPAVGDTWRTSFETADPAVTESTTYSGSGVAGFEPTSNVAGIDRTTGSLSSFVTNVTASGQGSANEAADKAHDGRRDTKWYMPSPTGYLRYELSSAQTVTAYRLTTANDFWQRNPKNWALQGSNNGTDWSTIDTRADQLKMRDNIPEHFSVHTYAVPGGNQAAYRYYQINVTANNGRDDTQLAEFELIGTSTVNPTGLPAMTTIAGTGPASSRTARANVGFTGLKSMRYSGYHVGNGSTARATNVLYSGLNITVGDDSELSYLVFPELHESDLTYPSNYVAIDVEYTDANGSNPRLLSSNSTLTDQYGYGITATEQGRAKTLWPDQWNKIRVDLASIAGKKITKVLLTYNNPDGSDVTSFQGWIDDIAISAKQPIENPDDSLTNYVDTRRGTNSSGAFSRGNNFPATAWPNGFNFFTPFTEGESNRELYKYQAAADANNRPRLQGIGISHEPSIWMQDRNQLAFMPALYSPGIPNAGLVARELSFGHENEIAQPDEYAVTFDNGIKAEVAPTDHAGIFRFTYPSQENQGTLFLDQVHNGSSFMVEEPGLEKVTGYIDGGVGSGVTRMYFSILFSQAATSFNVASGRNSALAFRFDTSTNKEIEVKIATSFISVNQATKNLEMEILDKNWGYDDVQSAAQAAWDERLGVIEVSGANDVEMVNLYSNLYRLNLYPNSQFENTGTASNPQYKYASPVVGSVGSPGSTTTNAQVRDGKLYVNNGFWDTYRTAWPLYSQLYPELSAELIDGFVQQYRDGGWISRWSSPGYSDLMTGTSSDASFAEAYVVGSLPTDLALEAYDAALKNATVLSDSNLPNGFDYEARHVGRKGLHRSIFLGYTPASQDQSVSWGLEGLINDYALAQMAKKLADDPQTPQGRRQQLREEAQYFMARTEDYVNLFDPNVGHDSPGFFQGRHEDGAFVMAPGEYTYDNVETIYNPEHWDGDYRTGYHVYTETDGWNFAFHAPYDVDGLASLYGGKDGLVEKLDTFFATQERAWSWRIHETFEARDVRMGQWGASNQVSFHIPYIYAAAGKPSRTQEIIRESLQRLFVGSEIGQGYPGDEDNGAMASWYIYGALGLYPLAPGSGEYTLGSPLYDQAVLRPLGTNNKLTITSNNNSFDNVYVQSVNLNGAAHNNVTVTTDDLTGTDKTLTFNMGATPSTWGEHDLAADAPTPQRDVLGAGGFTLSSSDGTSTANLIDNNSKSEATFSSNTPTLTATSNVGEVLISRYTITNGADGKAPQSWRLQGSNDGSNWVTVDERSGETFQWRTQTRPFSVASPAAYPRYRLVVQNSSSTAGSLKIAELELLVDGNATAQGPLQVQAISQLEAVAAAPLGLPVARITGGGSVTPGAFTAAVTLGGQSVPAVVESVGVGSALQVSLTGPLPESMLGRQTGQVTVTVGGQTEAAQIVVDVLLDKSDAANIVRGANLSCFSVQGVGGDCDGNGYAFDRAKVAQATGATFGEQATFNLGGDTFRYALPKSVTGQTDTIFPAGQTVPVKLAPGATKLSVLGFANEGTRSTTLTLNYTDGTNQAVPVAFGDWVGAAANPVAGTSRVFQVEGRLSGVSAVDELTAAVFATNAVNLAAGKQVKSVTFPAQVGNIKPEGQVHVVAFASNGSAVPAVTLTASSNEQIAVGTDGVLSGIAATASGGRGDLTAVINYGDGTGAKDAVIDVNGNVILDHVYSVGGTFTVSIVVHDGEHSSLVTREVRVEGASTASSTSLRANAASINAGGSVELTATVVPQGATGSVTFANGGNAIGTANLVAGTARLTTAALTAGVHTFTATYSGDATYLASTSAPVTVNVVPITSTPAVTAPNFSKKNQAFKSKPKLRASVASVVTGVTSGTVTFRSGNTVLGTAKVVKSGNAYTATLRLKGNLKRGTYRNVVAVLRAGAQTRTSAASPQTFKVIKARPKNVRVTTKRFNRGSMSQIKIRVGKMNNGRWAQGRVVVRVGGKKAATVRLKPKSRGKVTVRVPARYTNQARIKVKARFAPKAPKNFRAKASKAVQLRAK
ncbi:alpha-1,2-mannosidase, putative [Micrococcales bacterium KH10]|nr:alpha-1,2-mannosidase, putative [Micrococcales bacterium KH10]